MPELDIEIIKDNPEYFLVKRYLLFLFRVPSNEI
ncbi:Uncharacterised protein [Legionella pneumophila]|jgi:hypothetical protein|nr:hypothetical protein N748_03490 [Legionella pneumophila str. 121004]ERH41800.1 hypothetical protein N751_16930 [Legionella pneumophila str. Leg01/11]CZG69471.1 Uncharacterised protein [Legionella pneumophila]STX46613.1 Uncharacterised protein [Legionella hackeliae]SUQ35538.1 Uncharacterised protein [Legionella maceachernii]